MSTTQDFHLSILDQTVLRVYIRHLLIFAFPDPTKINSAIDALRSGISATLNQLPFLAGSIEQSDSESGNVRLRYPETMSPELVSLIFAINLNLAEDQSYDYDSLRRDGFPPSRLPSDKFCPKLLRNHPGLDGACAEGLATCTKGVSIPVFAAQATLIPGALVLSVYAHHAAIDGGGLARVYRMWSGHVRSFGVGMPQESITNTELDTSSMRHAFDALATSSPPVECPEIRTSSTPISPPPRPRPSKLCTKILVFPASKISQLSTNASSQTNTRISSFTALAALLWTHVIHARRATLASNNTQKTTFSIAKDHRRNMGPPFTTYLGNCATAVLTSVPISTILSPAQTLPTIDQLVPTALSISQSLSSIDLDWFKARLSLFSRTPNPHTLSLAERPDLFITSWMDMGADCEWSIPGTETSTPTATRKPPGGVEGVFIILPRRRNGPDGGGDFEVVVCLEEGDMGRVVGSLKEGEWLGRVIDG